MGQNWVETETSGCDLGDARLTRRLGLMLAALTERPGKSLPTAFQDWSLTNLQTRLIKIGARVVRNAMAVTFQLAEVALDGQVFGQILTAVQRLRAPPRPP